MARTPSNMVALGTRAPHFNLLNVASQEMITLDDLKSNVGTVIMFICNHCPFVVHIRDELVKICQDYKSKGISFIAISSNDVQRYPQDAPEKMAELVEELGNPFPYLYDESQETAKAYNAACTPDFYVYDGALTLVYRGQLDDSRPENGLPVTGKDLKNALDCIISGAPVSPEQKASIGCNIKWK